MLLRIKIKYRLTVRYQNTSSKFINQVVQHGKKELSVEHHAHIAIIVWIKAILLE
jgi:hypothetical protein